MQGIEFDEDNNLQGLKTQTLSTEVEKGGFIVRLLTKVGIADKATANLVLLSLVAILFGFTLYLYAGIMDNSAPVELSPEQKAEQQRVMKEMMGIK